MNDILQPQAEKRDIPKAILIGVAIFFAILVVLLITSRMLVSEHSRADLPEVETEAELTLEERIQLEMKAYEEKFSAEAISVPQDVVAAEHEKFYEQMTATETEVDQLMIEAERAAYEEAMRGQ